MLSCRAADRPQRALEERLARIGGGRQRDQRREPVEEVAGLLRHVGDVAGPYRDRQQHDVHGGEARDREALHQPARLAGLVGFRRARARTDARGSRCARARRSRRRRRASSSRQSTARRRLVKLSRASTMPGICFRPFSILRMQPAQPTPSTARSMCAMPPSCLTKIERSSVSDIAAPQRRKTRFLERNMRLAVARQLDDEGPLAGHRRSSVPRNVPGALSSSGTIWSPRRSVGCTSRAVAPQARERPARRVARDHLDQRRAVVGRNLGPHLPVQRVLGLGCCDLAREGEAGLIGIRGLDAAEGRNRGPDHDGVDTGDDREEADQADQHSAAGHLSRAAFVAVDRAVCRHRRPHGPRKWSTAVACRPVLGSVMRNVSGIEAAGGSV